MVFHFVEPSRANETSAAALAATYEELIVTTTSALYHQDRLVTHLTDPKWKAGAVPTPSPTSDNNKALFKIGGTDITLEYVVVGGGLLILLVVIICVFCCCKSGKPQGFSKRPSMMQMTTF
mmetsp:Transcript_2726/g.3184  ORF Transcript_2726/g.3184 Transcript_2726/m.3184 type:complete len:121 (+) Transcript_2726:127-489(+)